VPTQRRRVPYARAVNELLTTQGYERYDEQPGPLKGYRETMPARAMALMAQKLDASLALEGQFSAEGLAAMSADSGSLTMELAKSLVENIDFGDTERVWEKLRWEQPKPHAAPVEDDDDLVACRQDAQEIVAVPAKSVRRTVLARQFNLFS